MLLFLAAIGEAAIEAVVFLATLSIKVIADDKEHH